MRYLRTGRVIKVGRNIMEKSRPDMKLEIWVKDGYEIRDISKGRIRNERYK